MRPSVLIYNPRSGRHLSRRRLPAVQRRLRDAGFEVESRPTTAPGDATRLAREAVAGGAEVAFAMGGDGTLREVAAGVLGSDVEVGLLPAGTTNVIALTLGLPCDPRAAAEKLPECEPVEMDVGVAGDQPFLMLASAGLDAAIMARQDGELKRRFGKAAIAWTALRRWWRYRYPEIELRVGGRVERVGHFALCNVPYYGGTFRMAPDADYRDRRLDLVLFRGHGPTATLGLARDLALGRHLRRADVEIRRVEEVELLGPPGTPIQIDGDVPTVDLPLRLGLGRHRLRILAPR